MKKMMIKNLLMGLVLFVAILTDLYVEFSGFTWLFERLAP